MRIYSAKISDTGNYTCVATIHNFTTSLQYELKVFKDDAKDTSLKTTPSSKSNSPPSNGEYKPSWMKPERMQKKLHAEPAGNTVKFQCRVQGVPSPIVTWYKNGVRINKEDRISGYKIKNNGQLIILETVIPSDDGMYMCKATNKLGSINHTYELDVQGMIIIICNGPYCCFFQQYYIIYGLLLISCLVTS